MTNRIHRTDSTEKWPLCYDWPASHLVGGREFWPKRAKRSPFGRIRMSSANRRSAATVWPTFRQYPTTDRQTDEMATTLPANQPQIRSLAGADDVPFSSADWDWPISDVHSDGLGPFYSER